MRTARLSGESDVYHVVSRGVGQQIIFESDADRSRYLSSLGALLAESGGDLLAWCLMDNHVHLLVRQPIAVLSSTMRRLNAGYALYFNLVHGRSGHLFQGRFASEPVDTDEYLMTVVRYIHRNPVKAGMTPGCSYRWSSYDSYVSGRLPTGGGQTMALFGDVGSFVSFHEQDDLGARCIDVVQRPRRVDDDKALAIAVRLFGDEGLGQLKSLPREDRDAALARLKQEGLTIRQVQRLTGVSHGVVARA